VTIPDFFKPYGPNDLNQDMASKTEPARCRGVRGVEADRPGEPGGVEVIQALRQTLPRDAGVGKTWRFRRNLVIFAAHRSGIPQRVLADVFDLPASRICSIIKEIKNLDPRQNTN
jgi:hypothetical protein